MGSRDCPYLFGAVLLLLEEDPDTFARRCRYALSRDSATLMRNKFQLQLNKKSSEVLNGLPTSIMATVPPPPSKKQRTAQAEKTRQQQDVQEDIPSGLGNVRLRFYDEGTGNQIGDIVSVPVVDATVKNLELLVNSLLGKQVRSPIQISSPCSSKKECF